MTLKTDFGLNSSSRAVMWVAAIAALAQVLQKFVAEPFFESVTGFRPLDTQFPLSPVGIVIQLGAYDENAFGAYIAFSVSEFISAVSTGVFFLFLWRWMFSNFPNQIFGILKAGGILITPFLAPVCDIVENAGFVRLILGVSEAAYDSTLEFCIFIHRLKYTFQDFRLYLTLFFIGLLSISWMRRSTKDVQ